MSSNFNTQIHEDIVCEDKNTSGMNIWGIFLILYAYHAEIYSQQ